MLVSANTSVLTEKSQKRVDYLQWSDYFMAIAFLSAMRSKDPNSQVGACVVNKEKKIVGIGYNGMPNGCSDDDLPWNREADNILDTKYPYVCHAEMNAILNKNSADLKDCTIYVALFPCNECAKLIIQSGIKEIVYLSDKYHNDYKMVASRQLLDMAGVKYRQHIPQHSQILIDFDSINIPVGKHHKEPKSVSSP
ncbi:deoxycytidylate deaminase-like isoform X1 [Limulus polyphemus]|uniref:dCMP deaminase n=2 Tax=Limulus polyphemus TaxID=6850 RepID=A0ABM1BMK5_LIMPO|nr:deoxycytidylate deaminase-like isoform X1 [Limulus polyphemus]